MRALARLLPLAGAWLAVRAAAPWFLEVGGRVTSIVVWVVQAFAVAALVSVVVERGARRLLPLAALLNMSLVFPDRAPSKFAIALRAGAPTKLSQRIKEMQTPDPWVDANVAATRAIGLLAALSSHDRRTRGHTERVRAYADVIAEEMGMSQAERDRLAWGVLLHDVGKLAMPPQILNKKDALTATEWAILRDHPTAGRELLAPLEDWLGPFADAVADHHERWDGEGYPAGLAGTEISLAGRITAVADAYDVITSARSYKQAVAPDAARRELVRCAGSQFDPAVVRAFVNSSVGHSRNLGFLGWIFETPTLTQLGAGLSGAAVTVTAAGATSLAIASGSLAVDDVQPEALAFGAPTSAVELTVPELAVRGARPGAVLVPTTSTILLSTSTTAPSTIPPSTTAPPTTAPPTTVPPITTTVPSTTAPVTTTTTTTTPPTEESQGVWYLTNVGNASGGPPTLPLEVLGAAGGLASGHDVDGDGIPGLLIQRDALGLATSDHAKYQDWRLKASNAIALSGRSELFLFVGHKDLHGDTRIGVRVGLEHCTPECSSIAEADWTGTSTLGGLTEAVIDLGAIDLTLQPGEQVRLQVVAPDALTDDDITIAFDTPTEPSRWAVGLS